MPPGPARCGRPDDRLRAVEGARGVDDSSAAAATLAARAPSTILLAQDGAPSPLRGVGLRQTFRPAGAVRSKPKP